MALIRVGRGWLHGLVVMALLALGVVSQRPSWAGGTGKALGAACGQHSECASGACDLRSGLVAHVCVPAPRTGSVGTFCTGDDQCKTLTCHEGKCSSPLPNGGRCRTNVNCTSQRCAKFPVSANTYRAVCVPPDLSAEIGEFCAHPNHCKNKNCVSDKCAPPVALGQPCATHFGCTSQRCEGNPPRCIPSDGTGRLGEYCAHNHHCQNGSCVGLRCAAPPSRVPLGGWCSGDGNCLSGRCDGNSGAENQKCIPRDGTGAAGDYCSHPHQCKTGQCGGNVCGGSGTGTLPIGASCKNDSDCQTGDCDDPSRVVDPKCLPRLGSGKAGEYCSRDEQCQTQTCYRDSSSKPAVCTQPLPNGTSSCTTHTNCASKRCAKYSVSASTYSSVCVPVDLTGRAGDICTDHNQCASKRCVVPSGKPTGTCAANNLALGRACSTHEACASGRCDNRPGAGCVAHDGQAATGSFCTTHQQCRSGFCKVPGGKIAGTCRTP
jgi:hypothetical protein